MKNGLALFLGVFATMALSWTGLLLTAHRQLGALSQFKDPVDETLYPQAVSGLASQGRQVYQDLGCVTCHTQQVRPEGFGADLERQWGARGGYARDYLRDTAVLIGQSRLGPDLRNVGARSYAEADYFYKFLYAPQSLAPGTNMPAHRFLFDVRATAGKQPSTKAIHLPSKYASAPGTEIVPTPRAEALVAYLLSLKDSYDYPIERTRNTPAEKPKEEGAVHAKAPAGTAAAQPKEGSVTTAPLPTETPAEKPKEGGH